MANTGKILSRLELKDRKGIPFSRQHLHRLIGAGKFPKPVKLGEATNGWVESEVDEYIQNCITARDGAARKLVA
jgi:prophage regulatory protein